MFVLKCMKVRLQKTKIRHDEPIICT